ncbi:MAG: uroporphyrinogen decarboxylase [Defluviitaleaceae bacterium]|nr:uroporphyrinogen decarboxylase [Defluviitaleaceae bacterium]
MNSMQRVTAAIMREETDRCPVYPILAGISRKLVGATYKEWSTDAKICAEAFYRSVVEFELDTAVTLIDLSIECDAWGQPIIYNENDAAHPDYKNQVIKSTEDYAKIKKADYRTSERMMMHIDVCKRLVEKSNGEFPVVAFVFGPLGVLSMLRGQQEMYMDIYDDPDAVNAAAREINETLKDYVNAIIDTGVNAVMLDTLFASGSIMSKQMWKETEGGLAKELADICHARGCLVMIHNCGEKIYMDAQIESMNPCAISFLHVPDDCKDFYECKQKYGSKVTLIGCVPPPMAIVATDEEWIEKCKEQIDMFGAGGGYMLATGCEYPSCADLNKARLMVETAKSYNPHKKSVRQLAG